MASDFQGMKYLENRRHFVIWMKNQLYNGKNLTVVIK